MSGEYSDTHDPLIDYLVELRIPDGESLAAEIAQRDGSPLPVAEVVLQRAATVGQIAARQECRPESVARALRELAGSLRWVDLDKGAPKTSELGEASREALVDVGLAWFRLWCVVTRSMIAVVDDQGNPCN